MAHAARLDRTTLLLEGELPDSRALIDAGRQHARDVSIGGSLFADAYDVASESCDA